MSESIETTSEQSGVLGRDGKRHLVTLVRERHDFWTAAGELKGSCLCGWEDYYPYSPGGEDYARLKLRYRAIDHASAPE
jgi:hypothetical protein